MKLTSVPPRVLSSAIRYSIVQSVPSALCLMHRLFERRRRRSHVDCLQQRIALMRNCGGGRVDTWQGREKEKPASTFGRTASRLWGLFLGRDRDKYLTRGAAIDRGILPLSLSVSLFLPSRAILPSAAEAGIRDIPSAEINLTILDSFIACNWLQALYPDKIGRG